jgi:hypothetical protein
MEPLLREVLMLKKRIDLTGFKFGRLVVIRRGLNLPNGNPRWECSCECGNLALINASSLRAGRVKSCGCIRGIVEKHGMESSVIYSTWAQMKARCQNEKSKFYKDYGGRGIKVCDRWQRFTNFYADMGDKPEGLSLDRHPDNDGNYEPGNCRWATQQEQILNRRVTVMIEYNGEVKPRIEWARQYGISPISLTSRLKLGWDIHKALTTPIDKRKSVKKSKPKP